MVQINTRAKKAKQKSEKAASVVSESRRMTDFVKVNPNINVSKQAQNEAEQSAKTGDSKSRPTSSCQVNSVPEFESIEKFTSTHIIDVAFWPNKPEQACIDFWASRESLELQHNDERLFEIRSVQKKAGKAPARICTSAMFNRRNKNGEVVNRLWFCFLSDRWKII